MIDVQAEKLMRLEDARKHPLLDHLRKEGKPITFMTIWRWCRVGLYGVKLEFVQSGRAMATSAEAIARFFERSAAAIAAPKLPTAKECRTGHERAKARLAKLGI